MKRKQERERERKSDKEAACERKKERENVGGPRVEIRKLSGEKSYFVLQKLATSLQLYCAS